MVEVVIFDIHILKELVAPFLDEKSDDDVEQDSHNHYYSEIISEINDKNADCTANFNEHRSDVKL